MKCKNAQECISEYYDDQLDKKQWRELKKHLGTCSDCLKLFKKMGKLQERMNQLTVPARKAQKIELPARQKPMRRKALVYSFSAAGTVAVGLIALIIGGQVYTPLGFRYLNSTSPLQTPADSNGRSSKYLKAPATTNKASEDNGDAVGGLTWGNPEPKKEKSDDKKDSDAAKNLMLAQSVTLSLKVDSITETVKLITNIIENNDGYVVSTNFNGGYKTYTPSSGSSSQYESVAPYPTSMPTVALKVPAKHLKSAKKAIRKLGVVISENVNNEDVTLTVVDLEAKVRNYKRQESRYLKLIDKATTIADLQSLESSLANIRSTVEQTEAELKYQKSRVAMATINVRLTKKNAKNTSNSSNWFVENLSKGLIAFSGVTSVLMTLFFGLAPFMLLGLAVYGVIKIRRRFR